MQPKNLRFGGGLTDTVLHPYVAVAMIVAMGLILALPRRKVIVPFVLAFFSIPVGEVLVVFGAHFTMHQILILTVLGRMAAFRESRTEQRFIGGFKVLDWLVVSWSLVAFITFCLQFPELQAIVRGLAGLIETLGGYVAVRFLIPDEDTVRRMIKTFALVCVVQGACMISEQFTHQNVFEVVGANYPAVREGHVRSEGAMGTLYGGVLAGVLIPSFIWLWTATRSKFAAIAGTAGAVAMVVSSYASTSWMALGASLLGLGFWPLRKHMRMVRWGLVMVLIALHLVMNGPVWSLIAKIDVTGGSSSYHRYYLVDNCIRHFSDWWVMGCTNYGEWGFDMWDLCNQFVAVALTGGLASLILFIAIYKRGFGMIGEARGRVQRSGHKEWTIWCLGSALFANLVASFGINYLIHLMTYLFTLLVTISVVVYETTKAPTEKAVRIPARMELAFAGVVSGGSHEQREEFEREDEKVGKVETNQAGMWQSLLEARREDER
jgi:hypothetical protein